MLLRFPDLTAYGIRNWPALKRAVANLGFPYGFYTAPNTRVWDKSDCDRWLEDRRKAPPPPPKKRKPGPKAATKGTGPTGKDSTPSIAPEPLAAQPQNGGAA